MTTTITPANLTSIKFVASVPSGYTRIGTLSTGLPVYKGTTATEIAFIGKKIYAPVNSSSMFKSLTMLSNITFSAFDTSKVTSMRYMFYNCKKLASLNLSNFDTSKVIGMNSMFDHCSNLTSLDLSNFDTSNVTNMNSMFNSCFELTSLNVSSFDTSKVIDMNNMFYFCRKLASLNLSSFDTSKVQEMICMFQNCYLLESLDLSAFNMVNVTEVTNMLNFDSSNKIKTFKTPYNNSVEIPIITGITLYRLSNSVEISSVPANTASSFDIVGCESHNYSNSDTSYEPIDSLRHSMTTTSICSNCGCKSTTTKTMKHSFIAGVCKMCGYGKFIEYVINKNQDRRNIDIIFEKDKQRKEFFVLKVAG